MTTAFNHQAPTRRVRICYFNAWAGWLEEVSTYLTRVPAFDLDPLMSNPRDLELKQKARLDCDWYAANTRCFAAMKHEKIEFLPAWVVGAKSILEVGQRAKLFGEERWLVTMAHQPQALGALAGKVFALLAKAGVKHLFYAFDEASRFMPCFNAIAPSLDVLIHDEFPLAEAGRAKLPAGCRTWHRSWVANFIPNEAAFDEEAKPVIFFLGSQLGLTPHRLRQINFLRAEFKDRFVASYDHSISVEDRRGLSRYRVGFCPEGRKFTTPAMSATHTDRPFWSGCLGQVPVSEDSAEGGRLEELHRQKLILRYPRADLKALAETCERALSFSVEERRRIYRHFNTYETIGSVVAEAIAAPGN